MLIQEILDKITVNFEAKNLENFKVSDIAIDSREVKTGSVFFALNGINNDGAKFIPDAIKNGAKIIVSRDFIDGISSIKTDNVFAFLVNFLQEFYPNLPKNLYAITGTNGKTSVAEFGRQIVELLDKKAASIGTLGIVSDDKIANSKLTTPDILTIYKNLAELKQNGVDDVFIEVSSIGLEQKRIAGLKFCAGAFTNFSQDHLDYHKNMQDYFDCKMSLFKDFLPPCSFAILNSDIEEFDVIKKICEEKNHKIIDYGFKARKLKIKKIEPFKNGQEVIFENFSVKFNIKSDFQAFNLACAIALIETNYKIENFDNFTQLKTANGRMELVADYAGAQIYIDFAHSPDALENALKNAKNLNPKRLILLFGCGGNRDAKKRQLMGKIACDFSDLVIVTDDNPRKESPALIRQEIISACNPSKTIEVDGRKLAIAKALTMLQEGDILILAGKGHEQYQIIGDQKFEFNEKEIIKNEIFKLQKN
jgi:UDP-N-acetylmuramoyl-L-alanyl-D-glutamate--2,6-diaminopimelate ligase